MTIIKSRSLRALLGSGAAVALAVATLTGAAEPRNASAAPTTPVSTKCPWVTSKAPPGIRADEVLAQMTFAQKVHMMAGAIPPRQVKTNGYVPPIPSLCIPGLTLIGGPAGLHYNPFFSSGAPATALPEPEALAATFDPAMAKRYGAVIGNEAKSRGQDVVYGPMVNIVRDPRWGRAFETLGEDPYLSGSIGAAETKGMQQHGVIANLKHWDAYNQETYRNTPADNAIVSNRALHEIYMPAFRTVVKQAHPGTIMCSYATVNGSYSCQNQYLYKVLNKWGYKGAVISDYGATHSTVASANAGLDMELPLAHYYTLSALTAAVQDGQVSVKTIDAHVQRILAVMFQFGLFNKSGQSSLPINVMADAQVALKAAIKGTVLLKNSNSILPLNAGKTQSIAVIGPDAGTAMTGGGGSSHVDPFFTVTPLQGIRNLLGNSAKINYSDGSNLQAAAAAARSSSTAVVFVNDNETEGRDRTTLDLPGNQNQLIQTVAAANPNTIVVLDTGAPVVMPWLNDVKGVIQAWYSGEEDGNAIAAILFGNANPSGKLPITFPQSLAQVPASTAAQWPGVNGKVLYSEGLDVGYRWYDSHHLKPLFPFGFGLSYTRFSFSNLHISPMHGLGRSRASGRTVAIVHARVTNVGRRAGSEVVQLYVGDPASTGEPPRQLKGFERVRLAPGQSKEVTLRLTAHDVAYWRTSSQSWVTASGTYRVYVGDSSALTGLPLRGSFRLIG